MIQHNRTSMASEMRLYDRAKRRLYTNAVERERFLAAALTKPPPVRSLCLTLFYTGCRLSEALELSPASVQLDARLITFRTLKRRDPHVMREVPIPRQLAEALESAHRISSRPTTPERLWQEDGQALHRTTAYRWVKRVMAEAGIAGAQASPKGLRHGYGVNALRVGVPLNMLSKWMGHAALSTTAIYANASGREEQEIAARMWEDDRSL